MEELKSLVTDILTDRKKLVPGVIATVSLAVGIRQLLKYSRSGVVTQCDSHYDFVIVGAGSAGCVLANRLSASGKFKVLLIEAGDEETKYPAIPVPLLASQACTEPDAMWQDLTAPQDNCQAYKDQRSYTQHGKVLGGGSSVNWMIYARGHRDDYDSWEQKGCEGWGWDNVKEYFKKMENYFMRDRDDLGHRGPLTVSLNNTYRICDLLIEASAELGVPENPCYNSGVNNGATKSHTTIRNGERCSTAKAYLRPAMSRSNLHVITNAHVTKIIFEGKRATGVKFVKEGGNSYQVLATKEVIVSAGAINSPHLLLLSGVGPKAELKKHNIPLIADLPVGLNFQDHATVFNQLFFDKPNEVGLFDKSEFPTFSSKVNFTLCGKDAFCAFFREGVLSADPIQMMSFLDVKNGNYVMNDQMPKVQLSALGLILSSHKGDRYVSSLNLQPDVEHNYYFSNSHKAGSTLSATILHPEGTGSITLASSDPFDRPIIDPKLLSTPKDRESAKAGLRYMRDLANTQVLKQYGAHFVDERHSTRKRISPDVDPTSDEYLDEMINNFTGVLYHPAGSCKMGALGDTTAVVDPQLRVQGGIQGLRVVDNSIMPHLTSGNTNAPAIMIGEKGSHMIVQTYI